LIAAALAFFSATRLAIRALEKTTIELVFDEREGERKRLHTRILLLPVF
jgi:hypothetical protein